MKWWVLALSFIGCAGCLGNGSIVPGADFSACVIETAAKDYVAGMSPEEIALDCVKTCGGDLTTVNKVLAADSRSRAMRMKKDMTPAK